MMIKISVFEFYRYIKKYEDLWMNIFTKISIKPKFYQIHQNTSKKYILNDKNNQNISTFGFGLFVSIFL